MISEFEVYYNVKLFNRNGKGMLLTEEGTILYNRLNPLYEEMMQIECYLKKKPANPDSKLSVFYDWGNEPTVKQFQLLLEKGTSALQTEFYNIDSKEGENSIEGERNILIFSSRDIFSSKVKCYRKSFSDRYSLVISSHNDIMNVNKRLILCNNQKKNASVMKAAFLLKEKGFIEEFVCVGSVEIMHEMIIDGYGVGIVPSKYCFLSTWSDACFQELPETLPTFETNVFYSINSPLFKKMDSLLQQLL